MATPPTPFLTWDDSYAMHNEVIDHQHRHLVSMVSDLYEAVESRQPRANLGNCLTSLYNFARAHFATEEQLMRAHKFPKYDLHKAAHEGLGESLRHLRDEVVSGERELTPAYVELIKLWLIEHFGQFDTAYAPFLGDKRGPGCFRPQNC